MRRRKETKSHENRRSRRFFIRRASAAAAFVVVLCLVLGPEWLRAGEPESSNPLRQNVTARLFADASSAPESFYLVVFGTSLAVLGRFFARRQRPEKGELSPPSD
jgi:predicted cobalt transporter CbtA